VVERCNSRSSLGIKLSIKAIKKTRELCETPPKGGPRRIQTRRPTSKNTTGSTFRRGLTQFPRILLLL